MPSYIGRPPYTDEYVERLDNAEHVQSGTVGMKLVSLVDQSGNAVSIASASTTATLSNVPGSGSSVTLLASNTSRKGVLIDNNSSEDLFVTYGATSTVTAYTKRIKPYESWEPIINYTGVISGIWGNGVGFCRLTELT